MFTSFLHIVPIINVSNARINSSIFQVYNIQYKKELIFNTLWMEITRSSTILQEEKINFISKKLQLQTKTKKINK